MSIIYDLNCCSVSNLTAMQAAQRDFSPYLVHFTSYKAMKAVRNFVFKEFPSQAVPTEQKKPSTLISQLAKEVARKLKVADSHSFDVVKQILQQATIKIFSPNPKEEIPECVCLSQCTFPGLIGHSERFGRFGFVFSVEDIFKLGGRPSLYVDQAFYGFLDKHATAENQSDRIAEIEHYWPFFNVYIPPKNGRVQDYTLEREWRVLQNIELKGILKAMIAPEDYVNALQKQLAQYELSVPILPIDMLYKWGV